MRRSIIGGGVSAAVLWGGGVALAALSYSGFAALTSAAAAAGTLMTFTVWREHHPSQALLWLGHGARTMHQVLAGQEHDAGAEVTPLRESSAG